jgi:hypothetical protein
MTNLIHNTKEFLSYVVDGKVTEPVTLAKGCGLYGLSSITSLEGVTLAERCRLDGLSSLTSLEGVTLAPSCWFYGLSSLTTPYPNSPVVPGIDKAILEAVTSGGTLDMFTWHTCGTTHCRAGWAVHLAGEAGYALERLMGTEAAGACIYLASRPGVAMPDFYAPDDAAMADLRECASLYS